MTLVVDNHDELCSHGLVGLREQALRIAEAGLVACDPAPAVVEIVEPGDGGVCVAGVWYPLAPDARLVVLGAGKASLAIATALQSVLGDRIDAGAVVVRDLPADRLDPIELLGADHPLPSTRSVAAATRLLELSGPLGDGDLVIACFTGGSSALVSLPPEGVTFEEKRELHQLLLTSGMPITSVNEVRKHVSAFKGGRLAATIAPARLVNLTVSDVAGDIVDVITDPTAADTSTVEDAVAALRDYGIKDQIPESVLRHLRSDAAHSPDLSAYPIQTVMLATGGVACRAMAAEANGLGIPATTVSTSIEGEAREVGRIIANLAATSQITGAPFEPPIALLACGGESTVSLGESGAFGAGGPGQEAALSAALELDGRDVVLIALDTDGSDGGTDAAGAISDGETAARARQLDLDLRGSLLGHRSGEPLSKLSDLIFTGPTGTNVNDLIVVLIGQPLGSAAPVK